MQMDVGFGPWKVLDPSFRQYAALDNLLPATGSGGTGSTASAISNPAGPSCGGPNAPLVPLDTSGLQFSLEPPASRVILDFAPDVAARLRSAIIALNAEGIIPMIDSGFRTIAMQRQADPEVRYSPHEAGLAVDLNHNMRNFILVRYQMGVAGFEWGGGFSRPDPVHFFNDNPTSLKSGISNAQSYYKACIATNR